jgi:hypothetical protein
MDKNELKNLLELYTEKEISQIKNVHLSTVYNNLYKFGLRVKTKKDEIELFDTYTPESCYWAGFIAADGNILIKPEKGIYRVFIQLSSKDVSHLKKFKTFLGCSNKISTSKFNTSYIQICSKHLVESLVSNFNIVPNKSLILKPPLKMPKDLVRHYIRGYFDGDGHIGYNGGISCNFNIISGSKDIIDWISDILKSFNLISENHTYVKRRVFCIDIINQKSLNIFNWLYDCSDKLIRLDRKYEKYCDYKKTITDLINNYKELGIRPPAGCKGFDLDYKKISEEYLNGSGLKSLASKYNVSQWTLLARFKKIGIRKTTKRYLDEDTFSKYTKESCYWAGFLAADGWVSQRRLGCELSAKDENHLYKLRTFLKSNAEITRRTRESYGKSFNYCSIHISSVKLVKDLDINFNIVPNKSLVYCHPDNLPGEFIRDFIRGYIDGDGSIGWHKYNKVFRLSVCSGSLELITWIKDNILNNITFRANPTITKREGANLYVVGFLGKYVNEITDWLYSGSCNNIRLDRKFEIHKNDFTIGSVK